MDKYEFKKYCAAILLTILIWLSIDNLASIIYKPQNFPKHRGFSLISSESSTKKLIAQDEQLVNIAKLMAKASSVRGQQLAKKCINCHTLAQGATHKIGPNLWGVVGRAKARLKNYNYSVALKNKGGIWDYQDLFTFLQNPQELVPGTKMFFLGLEQPQAIADIIAYLKLNSSNDD